MSSEGPYARGEHAGAPVAMLLAGPNGAGKSTSSRLLVPRQCVFLNADVIAARLRKEGHQAEGLDIAAGPCRPCRDEAPSGRGRLFLRCDKPGRPWPGPNSSLVADEGVPGVALLRRAPEPRAGHSPCGGAGGGHYVADEVVRRRWKAGLKALFEVYIDAVDQWSVVDNSERVAVPVARGGGGALEIEDGARWSELRRLAENGR